MSFNRNVVFSLLIYGAVLAAPSLVYAFSFKNEDAQLMMMTTITTSSYLFGVFLLMGINAFTKEASPLEIKKASKINIFLWGFGGIFLALIFQIAISLIELTIFGKSPESQNTETISSLVQLNPMMMLAVTLAGPFMEEFIFRRSLSGLLAKYLSPWLSGIITSALFSLAHVDGHFLLYFGIGFLFFFLYKKTGSIFTSIIAHCGMNLIALLLTLQA